MAMAMCHCGGTIVGGQTHICKPTPSNVLAHPKDDFMQIGKINFDWKEVK